MKNKASKNNFLNANSSKVNSRIDSKEAAKLITNNKQNLQSTIKKNKEDVSKAQINRLKQFYNTTRWLPNSAFTTYFGKPAFENYGNGNTKPVYGGLFYGNYLLSHNINPMDGPNSPNTKQVYSSAMLKATKNNKMRRPSPPRKTPDDIRNTPDELEEISSRNPIFQLPNHFPARDIIKPNLLKTRFFKSGKNTPNESFDNNANEYEVFNIEDVLNNKTNKKKQRKTISNANSDFNPFNQAKPTIQKKRIKEELDQEINQADVFRTTKSRESFNNEEHEYMIKKQFYEKMLAGDMNNDNDNNSSVAIDSKEEKQIQTEEDFYKSNEDNCALCQSASFIDQKIRLKKKDNPCLMEPKEIKHTIVCCIHHSNNQLSLQEKDPKNYKHLPSCTMDKIKPAGKPLRYSESVGNLFK